MPRLLEESHGLLRVPLGLGILGAQLPQLLDRPLRRLCHPCQVSACPLRPLEDFKLVRHGVTKFDRGGGVETGSGKRGVRHSYWISSLEKEGLSHFASRAGSRALPLGLLWIVRITDIDVGGGGKKEAPKRADRADRGRTMERNVVRKAIRDEGGADPVEACMCCNFLQLSPLRVLVEAGRVGENEGACGDVEVFVLTNHCPSPRSRAL